MIIDTLGDLYRRNAYMRGDQTAVLYGGRSLTHGQLLRSAEGLAQSWMSRGLARGDRVALLSKNRPDYLIALAACEMAGFVAVGLNYRLSVAELAVICGDCTPRLLLVDQSLAANIPGILDVWRPDLGVQEMDTREFIQACDTEPGPATERGCVRRSDLGYLIYTSGTTGKPKGVMLSHGALVSTARSMAIETGAQSDDLLAAAMPLFHIGARCKTLGYALRGAGSLLFDQFIPSLYLAQSMQFKVTAWHLAPSMVQAVLDELKQSGAHSELPRLRALHYAAAPMPLPVLAEAADRFGPILRQFYGMTETGAAGTVLGPDDHTPKSSLGQVSPYLGTAGQAILDADVCTVRTDGNLCKAGEPGEVKILSASNMLGYWNNPEATRETLQEGWVFTGDIGVIDANGFLTILDRKKDMLISGGENIYPREVEDALLSHPDVAEAAVIGMPDERWGETVLAYVVPRMGTTRTEEELIEHVKTKIASYKKPRAIRFVDRLPRLATGKVDKKALRASKV